MYFMLVAKCADPSFFYKRNYTYKKKNFPLKPQKFSFSFTMVGFICENLLKFKPSLLFHILCKIPRSRKQAGNFFFSIQDSYSFFHVLIIFHVAQILAWKKVKVACACVDEKRFKWNTFACNKSRDSRQCEVLRVKKSTFSFFSCRLIDNTSHQIPYTYMPFIGFLVFVKQGKMW